MKFERWFWKDDTPGWSRNARRFLLVTSVLLLVAMIWWFAQ